MKEENKKLLSILVVVIVVASAMATAVTFGMKYFEEEEEIPLSVKIFADSVQGEVPYTVTFTSLALNYEGTLNYNWDFGNGNTSEEINPEVTYYENGTFRCNLTIKDNNGETATDSIVIIANPKVKQLPVIGLSKTQVNRHYIPGLPLLLDRLGYGDRFVENVILESELLTKLCFSGKKGLVTCTAQVNNPEDIVKYKWTLRPPSYVGNALQNHESIEPVYEFEGINVTFPASLTYRRGQYRVILEVYDSEGGEPVTATESFKVESSQAYNEKKGRRLLIFGTIGWLATVWKTQASKQEGSGLYNIFKLVFELPLEWENFPGLAALTIFTLKFIFDVGELDVWDKTPEKVADYYEKQIANGRFDEDEAKKRIELWANTPIIQIIIDWTKVQEELGFINLKPKISNPSPKNNAELLNLTETKNVWISVNDPEADTFNVCIYGDYINTTANHYVNYTNVSNSDGPFSAPLITPLPPSKQNLTYINWHVKVVDPDYSDEVVEKDFRFSTAYE